MWLDSKAVNCPQKWGNFKEVVIEFLAVVLGCFLPAWGRVMLRGVGSNLYFKGGV